jgi:hypothetical protein
VSSRPILCYSAPARENQTTINYLLIFFGLHIKFTIPSIIVIKTQIMDRATTNFHTGSKTLSKIGCAVCLTVLSVAIECNHKAVPNEIINMLAAMIADHFFIIFIIFILY